MPVIGRARPELLELEAGEDVQHLQDGDALPRRRQLPDVVAAIVRADRVDPGAGVVLEVLEREQAAGFVGISRQLLGDAALVKRGGPFGTDLAIDTSERGVL